jgi:hypothetical protein
LAEALATVARSEVAYWHYPLFSSDSGGPTPAVPTRHRPLFFDHTVDPLDSHVETRGPGGPPATESCR